MKKIIYLIKKVFKIPTKILVIHEELSESRIQVYINCPLCLESKEWPFPKDRHWNGYHFKLGTHWKPEKGHKDYEYHISGRYRYKK